MISYEECVVILDSFRPNGPQGKNEIGARVRWDDANKKPMLTVVVRKKKNSTNLPTKHVYHYDNSDKEICIEVTQGVLSSAFVSFFLNFLRSLLNILRSWFRSIRVQGHSDGSGDVCGGDSVTGWSKTGTAGWFFRLNDALLCIGNSHVFGKHDTITVFSPTAKTTGTIVHRLPVKKKTANEWDLALACMNANDVEASMRPTEAYTYPLKIVSDLYVGDGKIYRAVTRHEGWGRGYLYAVFSGYLMYSWNRVYFRNQLQFVPTTGKAMTEPGDSGTIAIQPGDNGDSNVVGLMFGRTREGNMFLSLANPLFRLGLEYQTESGFPVYKPGTSNIKIPAECPHVKSVP